MAITNSNFVTLEKLSACDYTCVGTKLRVKNSGYVSNQLGSDTPGTYNAPTDPSAGLKDGAIIIEAFDDKIHYWKVACTAGTGVPVYTLTLSVDRGAQNPITTFSSMTGSTTGLNPTAPATPPAVAITGSTLIQRFSDYDNYWTYNGTSWVLNWQSATSVDAHHNYDTTQAAVTYNQATPVTTPTNPPANLVNGATLEVPYANGTAVYSYNGTAWSLLYFDVDCCPIFTQNDTIGSVIPNVDGNPTYVYNTSNGFVGVVLGDGTIITNSAIDINSTHENNAAIYTDGSLAAEQPTTPVGNSGDTAIVSHPNGTSYWTSNGTVWSVDFFKDTLDCCTTYTTQNTVSPVAGTNAAVGLPAIANTGDTLVNHHTDFAVFYTYDGTNWVENDRIPIVDTVGDLTNVNVSADAPATDGSVMTWDATASEWVEASPNLPFNCADLVF